MNLLFLVLIFAQEINQEIIEKKSTEAREILKKESVTFKRAGKNSKSKIVSRDILLAVGSDSLDKINTVKLVVDVPKSVRNKSFKFKIVTPGYNVERISGVGITRLNFRVTDKNTNEELVVWDSRHLHLEKQRTSPRDLFYFPYSDYFLSDDIVDSGKWKLFAIIVESQAELCVSDAKSRAYPKLLLCQIVPDLLVATLGASEQSDDQDFFADSEKTVSKFLTHIARNREQAFYYSISVDGARGLMQFMNSRRVGTYDLVKKRCPEIGLIADYEKGIADMKNSIKAAICLADMNLSLMPESAKKKFLEDPFLGGEAVAVAHNAGLGRALNFLKGRRIPKETQNFLKKYRETWKILERRTN